MDKLESISEDAEKVSKVAGAVVSIAMASTALIWVGSAIKNGIQTSKQRRADKKAAKEVEVELTAV